MYAPRRLDTGIARRREPAVCLVEIENAVAKLGGDGPALISRTVIDYDHLHVNIALIQHAANGVTQILSMIEIGNDHTDERIRLVGPCPGRMVKHWGCKLGRAFLKRHGWVTCRNRCSRAWAVWLQLCIASAS